MDPDLFITIVFDSLVALFAFGAALVMLRMRRRDTRKARDEAARSSRSRSGGRVDDPVNSADAEGRSEEAQGWISPRRMA